MQIGSCAFAGLTLGDVLRLRAEAGQSRADPSVIVLWLAGAPSHLETYDLKPEAPVEFRGEFRPIPTNVPGIDLCEHLPLHAQVADKFTLIRSLAHGYQDHGPGQWRFLSGRLQPVAASDGPSHFPELGSIVNWAKREERSGLPNFICVGRRIFEHGLGYLDKSHAPFHIDDDPNGETFEVKDVSLMPGLRNRLEDRMHLLRGLEQLQKKLDRTSAATSDKFYAQALELLSDAKLRRAFDLHEESERTRDRYGRHKWGQRVLLARRLAEAGSSLVHVQLQNIYDTRLPGKSVSWDDHANLKWNIFTSMKERLPIFDRALTALIEDIYECGLDRKILVVACGEFSRTPRVHYEGGVPGREHWGNCMSVLVSGGGLRMGQVVGATNAHGEVPAERPLDSNDLLATIYRHLGINYEQAIVNHSGRPMPILPYGEPIRELL